MSKINRLTPNECIDRGLQAPSKSHERSFWFELAKLMLDAAPLPVVYDGTQGLTMEVGGGLYRHYGILARHERFERTHRHGVAL